MTDTTQDPLAMPAGAVAEPSFPLLREGIKKLIVREVTDSQAESGFKYLSIKLATTEMDQSSEGATLNPGFAFNAMISLTPNENNTMQQIVEQASMFVKAALGKGTQVSVADVRKDPSIVTGKIVEAKIAIRKSKNPQYSDSNVVKNWIVPA